MIKKMYYTLSSQEFNNYLTSIKSNPGTIHFLNNTNTPYFLILNQEVQTILLDLHKKELELNYLFSSLTHFQKELVIQTCKLDEIQSTNLIENIYSTKSDIFGIMNHVNSIRNKKIVSIINSYEILESISNQPIQDLSEITDIYKMIMNNAYQSLDDQVDGKYFRKRPVYIMDGIKNVHTGFYPENNIIEGMKEWLSIINNNLLDLYLRLLLSHFIFETIHPYYDGNGRYGRFLMSYQLMYESDTLYAYCIASSINKNKNQYYHALESARDIREYGCVNDYIISLGNILLQGMDTVIKDIHKKLDLYNQYISCEFINSLTKSEKLIYDCLIQATIFTYFGISNEIIINETNISKRTIISAMNKFRKEDLLLDYKLGKVTYHKVKNIPTLEE